MEPLFCGIDVGTQGSRCVIATEDGKLAGSGEAAFVPAPAPSAVGAPDGGLNHEQEPGSWTAAVRRAVRQALGSIEGGERTARAVAAVSVTSTSGTLCVLDADGRPLMPAIMYNDARGAAEAPEVQAAGGDVADRLGYRFGASFALPKILWLVRRRPDILRQARILCSPTDYIIGWLTGRWHRSDQSNCLKWGYDLIDNRWPRFITAELGIAGTLLPDVQMSGTEAGRITPERAEQLGLPARTPVAAGMTDGCASQVASGAAAPGQYNTTIGTTMIIKGVSERLLLDPLGRLYCHKHPDGWWLPGGASNTGADCLLREFGPEETEALSHHALQVSPTRVVAYPLVGRGERFPFMDPQAEGFLVGASHGRQELFAAYLEGVACLERLALETIEGLGGRVGDTVFSTGGGARSDAWLQIRADTLNKTVKRPTGWGSAMGAAIVAASMGHYPTLGKAAAAMVDIEREAKPRANMVAAYGDKYGQFLAACAEHGYVDTRTDA